MIEPCYIDRIQYLFDRNNKNGPIIFFIPYHMEKVFMKELFGIENDEEMNDIYDSLIVSELNDLSGVRATIINYNGNEYAFIDPERILISQ